jgi:7-cyano-7-deazaguanine synthase
MIKKKSIVLFSGGMDSTTCLAFAKSQGFKVYALSFDYGQRHIAELTAAQKIIKKMGDIQHEIVPLSLPGLTSSLTNLNLAIPTSDTPPEQGIPSTYVPARNTIFLSIALGYAEALGAYDIFIGVSSVDYSGYPDCRPEYIEAFQQLANLATKAGVEGQKLTIHTPLIHLNKAETIQLGESLGVRYQDTITCYQADREGRACGICPSCMLRIKGFKEAELDDPTPYKNFIT